MYQFIELIEFQRDSKNYLNQFLIKYTFTLVMVIGIGLILFI